MELYSVSDKRKAKQILKEQKQWTEKSQTG